MNWLLGIEKVGFSNARKLITCSIRSRYSTSWSPCQRAVKKMIFRVAMCIFAKCIYERNILIGIGVKSMSNENVHHITKSFICYLAKIYFFTVKTNDGEEVKFKFSFECSLKNSSLLQLLFNNFRS